MTGELADESLRFDEDDRDDEDVCSHGVGFDEHCENCNYFEDEDGDA